MLRNASLMRESGCTFSLIGYKGCVTHTVQEGWKSTHPWQPAMAGIASVHDQKDILSKHAILYRTGFDSCRFQSEGRKFTHPWQPTRLNGWNSVCLSSA